MLIHVHNFLCRTQKNIFWKLLAVENRRSPLTALVVCPYSIGETEYGSTPGAKPLCLKTYRIRLLCLFLQNNVIWWNKHCHIDNSSNSHIKGQEGLLIYRLIVWLSSVLFVQLFTNRQTERKTVRVKGKEDMKVKTECVTSDLRDEMTCSPQGWRVDNLLWLVPAEALSHWDAVSFKRHQHLFIRSSLHWDSQEKKILAIQ